MGAGADRHAAPSWRLDAEQSRLVQRHVRLAEKIAHARCLWGLEDPDDTRSDALWGLILAARAFQPDRGSFTNYATLRIGYAIRWGRQIRSGLPRSVWAEGRRPTVVSLNTPIREGGPQLLDVLPGPPDAEEELLADLLRRLPARECLVLRLRYYHDLSQSDVAAIIGRSQIQVSRIERAALAKLRDFVADHPAPRPTCDPVTRAGAREDTDSPSRLTRTGDSAQTLYGPLSQAPASFLGG